MKKKIKSGDVVNSIDDYFDLFVRSIKNNYALCIWFDQDGIKHEKEILLSKLRLANNVIYQVEITQNFSMITN